LLGFEFPHGGTPPIFRVNSLSLKILEVPFESLAEPANVAFKKEAQARKRCTRRYRRTEHFVQSVTS
jgi:hypothetical protein